MIRNVLVRIMFFSLTCHNSTPMSSQKLSFAPFESSRRDAHDSEKSKIKVQTQPALLLESFLDEEFDFRGHDCSKTVKSVDFRPKHFPSDQ